jgi:hypothetical protein
VGAHLTLQRGPLGVDLTAEVSVALCERIELDEVARAALDAVPRRDQLAVLRSFARDLAGVAWVVPGAGARQLGV